MNLTLEKVIIRNGEFAGKKGVLISESKGSVLVRLIEEKHFLVLSEDDIEPI